METKSIKFTPYEAPKIYEPGYLLSITGIIKEIIKQKAVQRGSESAWLIEFVLEVIASNANNNHLYFIKAFSNTGHDRFNINGRLGQIHTCNLYLNGRKVRTEKGFWHHNELSLHSIN